MATTQVAEARHDIALENMLINGGFEVWQRNTTFSVGSSDSIWTTDEWRARTGASFAGSVSQTAGQAGDYALRYTITTPGSTPIWLFQGVEQWDSLQGQYVTFSAMVKSSTAGVVRLGVNAWNGAYQITYGTQYHSGSGNWERISVIAKLPTDMVAPSGDVSLPHDFAISVFLWINQSIGAGTVVDMDSAMLAVGYFPESVPFVPNHPAEDWEKCQRFYEKRESQLGYGQYYDYISNEFEDGQWYDPVSMTVRKFAVPTVTVSNISYPNTPRSGWVSLNASNQDFLAFRMIDAPNNDDQIYARANFDWDAEVA